ncbi:hypothetical protein LPJ57_002569 [Coemansia sp. RSA 486]|nr:hypothetical protein LPJ57_002569 [Coemansia sp. RSA 486]KAJ2636141.1 hypothetical protein GGF40_003187 [Coemansia sp. RSA 1286]
MSLAAHEMMQSLPGARTWRMRKPRFSYATLINEEDGSGLPNTQLYAADDLVSTDLETDTEDDRLSSSRNSTTRVPVHIGEKLHWGDSWSDITTLERFHKSLDADLPRDYHQNKLSDYDEDDKIDKIEDDGGLQIESRARRLRRRARRQFSEAMEKARNGWTTFFLAILQGRRNSNAVALPHIF